MAKCRRIRSWFRRSSTKPTPSAPSKGGANVLIFPNLEAGNIAYKLLHHLGGAELVGPLLTGLSKPVHVLQRDSEVNDIVRVAAVAVFDAQEAGRPYPSLARVAPE
jgi:malate dehydrogenase (oxaloacetate-decarboxylating)(NADP+)